ncbi:MAG TPA: BON domain-containing protein [Vicinamibacterales bacterium]|nr:BON domain-containing protein [Vicinamibacterales bacterium]
MNRLRLTVAAILLLVIANGGAPRAQTAQPQSVVDEVREELLQLPTYCVFDFLAFAYQDGTVTLMGYASTPTLPIDAERAVGRASGVRSIVDKIDVLPITQEDNDVRWSTYYAIYRDSFLSRYAPGAGTLWGHTHTFPTGHLMPLGPIRFLGTEPAGDYPIHIIVRNGRIMLLGVVDCEADKDRAGLLARGVSGAAGVDNELTVDAMPSS